MTVQQRDGVDVVGDALEDWELFTVLRRKAGLRQEDVAAAAGCSQPTLSRWERGRARLSDDLLARLWGALSGEPTEGAA